MPSLKRVVNTPEKGKRNTAHTSTKQSLVTTTDGDDRFSQAPDHIVLPTHKNTKNSTELFSIASAISNHRNNIHTSVNNKGKRSSDIVAVVLSSPMQQESLPIITLNSKTPKKCNNNNSRIHLYIGDHSLSSRRECARVSMNVYSSSSISASLASLLGVDGMGGTRLGNNTINKKDDVINKHQLAGMGKLQPGDVVCLNGFEVRNDYQNEKVRNDYQNEKERNDYQNESTAGRKKRKLSNTNTSDEGNLSGLLSVACDLSLSWRDPTVGLPLIRLCRIIPKSDVGLSTKKIQQKGENYVLEWENGIPPSMETKEDVMKLASWYCTHARSHLAMSTVMPINQPCQRRKLRDISSPNLLSNVVVKVLRCEKAYATPRKTTTAPDSTVLTHVTLYDGTGSEDLMGFGGCVNHGRVPSTLSSIPKTISPILQQSMKEGSRVLLTNVLSQASKTSLQCRESLVLVPTRETIATIITLDHPYYSHDKSTSEGENLFISQPLTVERASQLFTFSQQHTPTIIKNAAAVTNHCRGVMAVVSPLMDILVDGVDTSFMEGSHWKSPHTLSKFLIDCPSISTGMQAIKLQPSYRSATLLFDPKLVSSDIHVNADGNAMKLLCLDVPVLDMVMKNGSTSNPYLCHIGQLLRTLCTEKIPIRWVLEQESECSWFVTDATLLEV